MSVIQSLLKEMNQEAQTTRKMLSRVPTDKFNWKPHEKSMTMRQLATHIADIPTWINMVLATSELDFAQAPYEEKVLAGTPELMEYFEKCQTEGHAALEKATEADLQPNWTLRNGEQVFFVTSKGEMIRTCYSQIVHHRAQLGVYLRLLDIPIPGSYGPSADEPM